MRQERLLKGIRVLTTDAEKRIGLYAIRYLGRAGAAVSSIARGNGGPVPLGFLSHYCATGIMLERARFAEDLKTFLLRHAGRFQVLVPIDISQMLCVIDAARAGDLKAAYLLPPRDSLVTADNKELLVRHARQLGLECPRTYMRLDPADLEKLCRKELTFPCIIKFRGDSRETHWNPEERYSIVRSPQQLIAEYERMHAIEPYPVVQEYIEGRGYGYFALYDRRGALKAQFCHRRIREFPARGGPSSCCESMYDPELVRIGRRLLESLDWKGLAMVEFKFDEKRKRYSIIEVNPRYWGSLPLAVSSGVNFPVLHALSALDRSYDPVLQYRLGTKVRFFDRDLKAILSLVGVEKGLAGKIALLLQIFNPALKEGLLALDDLRPVLGRVLHLKGRTRIVDGNL